MIAERKGLCALSGASGASNAGPLAPHPHPPLGMLRGTISKKGDHSDRVYLFQDHPVLETVRHFRIILGLEYAGQAHLPVHHAYGRGGKPGD